MDDGCRYNPNGARGCVGLGGTNKRWYRRGVTQLGYMVPAWVGYPVMGSGQGHGACSRGCEGQRGRRLNRDVAGPWKPVGQVTGLVRSTLVWAEWPI